MTGGWESACITVLQLPWNTAPWLGSLVRGARDDDLWGNFVFVHLYADDTSYDANQSHKTVSIFKHLHVLSGPVHSIRCGGGGIFIDLFIFIYLFCTVAWSRLIPTRLSETVVPRYFTLNIYIAGGKLVGVANSFLLVNFVKLDCLALIRCH